MARITLRVAELIAQKSKTKGQEITPTDVARAIGVSHNTILSYVRNEVRQPTLEVLAKLCVYFECSLEELMVLEEKDTPKAWPSLQPHLTAARG